MKKHDLAGIQGEIIPPETATDCARKRETPDHMNTALALALVADLLQLVLFPLFVEGAASGLDDVVDFAVGITMVKLLGWHWVFLPSMLTKLLPGLDELPCWTMAVLFVRAERAKTLQNA